MADERVTTWLQENWLQENPYFNSIISWKLFVLFNFTVSYINITSLIVTFVNNYTFTKIGDSIKGVVTVTSINYMCYSIIYMVSSWGMLNRVIANIIVGLTSQSLIKCTCNSNLGQVVYFCQLLHDWSVYPNSNKNSFVIPLKAKWVFELDFSTVISTWTSSIILGPHIV